MSRSSLQFVSDVVFTLDGPRGSSSGRIEAVGSRLIVHATDPLAALESGLVREAGSAALAEFLADVGVTVEMHGPRGFVLAAGAGINSAVGRVVGGSRRVRLGSVRATRPLLALRITPLRRRRLWLSGAAVGSVVAAARWRRRRH